MRKFFNRIVGSSVWLVKWKKCAAIRLSLSGRVDGEKQKPTPAYFLIHFLSVYDV